VTAGIVSFTGASNVISTMMEGLRRARELPVNCWSFWERRRRTFELVPLSLLPLAIASLLVVFGHTVTGWIAWTFGPELRQPIFVISVIVRWALALGSSVGVIGLIYHLGVPDAHVGFPRVITKYGSRYRLAGLTRLEGEVAAMPSRSWQTIVPGAVMATAMWFLTTLVFGWYVTRFANYSEVYGSLGAGIALLFWLYIISLSVLCGAEFNAQLDKQFRGGIRPRGAKGSAVAEKSSELADC
jgi:membrane protein